MKEILVDTCIWSLALRGKEPRDKSIAEILTNLIYSGQVRIIGSIRQEVLSGYSVYTQYAKLRDKLEHFPNDPTLDEDYILAAEFSNRCRSNGIQGSHTDFLICAVAHRLKVDIYTTDKDFNFYEQHLPIKLFAPTG